MQNTNPSLVCHVYVPIASTSSASANSHGLTWEHSSADLSFPLPFRNRGLLRPCFHRPIAMSLTTLSFSGALRCRRLRRRTLSACSKPHDLDPNNPEQRHMHSNQLRTSQTPKVVECFGLTDDDAVCPGKRGVSMLDSLHLAKVVKGDLAWP